MAPPPDSGPPPAPDGRPPAGRLRVWAGKLLVPLLVSAVLTSIVYLGGDAYQVIGLQALETTGQTVGVALSIAVIVSLAVLVQRVLQYLVLEGLVAPALGTPVPKLLVQLSGLVVTIVAVAAIAGFVFNQDLTALWAASGIAGVVFGMALRELILDIFSGLALNLDRPIRIGDRIQVSRTGEPTITGRVLETSWRSTRMHLENDTVAIVPNSRMASGTIINLSLPDPVMEYALTVTVDADVDPDRVMRVLEAAALEAAAGYALPKAPPPYVRLRAIGPDGVEYGLFINPTAEVRYRARSETYRAVLKHMARAGIRPSWPKRLEAPAERPPVPLDGPTPAQMALLLGAVPLFVDLTEEERLMLAGHGRLRRLPAETTLVQAGEAASSMLLLVEGLLVATTVRGIGGMGGSSGRAAAGMVPLAPGTLVGADALLTGGSHGRTVRTRTSALLCEFGHDALGALVAHRPGIAERLSRRIAEQMVADRQSGGGRAAGTAAVHDLAEDVLGNLRRLFGDRALH
ncbi:mechanosensitive ion channel family protein [Azospirillum halopraeferens]|uniref:mechanosensitive ion channel family protein n=1 Tax=Azospirillum halopraeferens TaxID=34010 RepID=UPI0003FB0010|nr:mechanosensitive ion channel family protein [Azospirillum halopraeferens]